MQKHVFRVYFHTWKICVKGVVWKPCKDDIQPEIQVFPPPQHPLCQWVVAIQYNQWQHKNVLGGIEREKCIWGWKNLKIAKNSWLLKSFSSDRGYKLGKSLWQEGGKIPMPHPRLGAITEYNQSHLPSIWRFEHSKSGVISMCCSSLPGVHTTILVREILSTSVCRSCIRNNEENNLNLLVDSQWMNRNVFKITWFPICKM